MRSKDEEGEKGMGGLCKVSANDIETEVASYKLSLGMSPCQLESLLILYRA